MPVSTTTPEATLQALNDIGVDFSVARTALLGWLGNPEFTPFPALANALLNLGVALMRPVFIDVVSANYEQSPGAVSPRRPEDVNTTLLKSAVVGAHNSRYGENVLDFGTLTTPIDPEAGAPSLSDFGHGTMLTDGKPASGSRPLILILAEYSDNDAGDFPTFDSLHFYDNIDRMGYYFFLGFGRDPRPPFSTSDPVNPASLHAYFKECSLGRFELVPGARLGPMQMGDFAPDPGPEKRFQRIIKKAIAEENMALFWFSDDDGDNRITSSEAVVLIFENIKGAQPANRGNDPVQFTMDLPSGTVTRTVHVSVAGAGPLTPFYQIAHEVSHCFGTIDMYNSGAGNTLLTLMGGYPFFSNDQGIVHLDAWHKLALGWCEPRRRRLDAPGDEALLPVGSPAAPIILWHPQRSASEYFIVEWRQRSSTVDLAYEASLPDDGALIWRVKSDAPTPATHLGSPDLTVGGNGVWKAGATTPPLTWDDGTEVGISLTFDEVPGLPAPAVRMTW
ncbi:hypothetical protein ABQF34_03640 [Mycolicibacterium boenickei]